MLREVGNAVVLQKKDTCTVGIVVAEQKLVKVERRPPKKSNKKKKDKKVGGVITAIPPTGCDLDDVLSGELSILNWMTYGRIFKILSLLSMVVVVVTLISTGGFFVLKFFSYLLDLDMFAETSSSQALGNAAMWIISCYFVNSVTEPRARELGESDAVKWFNPDEKEQKMIKEVKLRLPKVLHKQTSNRGKLCGQKPKQIQQKRLVDRPSRKKK